MVVKSRIFLNELVDNTNPRARADSTYVVAYVQLDDGSLRPALFTDGDIQKAMKRATANKEDVPPAYFEPEAEVLTTKQKTWLDKVLGR